MKRKGNKKRYNFTENQLRKDRSLRYHRYQGVPKWYTDLRNKGVKNKCKMILRNNIINGTDKSYPIFKQDAGWYWW